MRRPLLVIVPSVIVVTLVVAFGVTLSQTGTDAAGPNRAGFLTVNVTPMRPGTVETKTVPIAALQDATWPVFVVAEPTKGVVAFLARSPHLGCRLMWVGAPHYQRFSEGSDVAFEDPCGGAEFAFDGRCIAGPCSRGMDQFPVVVANVTARINLNTIDPGQPRTR